MEKYIDKLNALRNATVNKLIFADNESVTLNAAEVDAIATMIIGLEINLKALKDGES